MPLPSRTQAGKGTRTAEKEGLRPSLQGHLLAVSLKYFGFERGKANEILVTVRESTGMYCAQLRAVFLKLQKGRDGGKQFLKGKGPQRRLRGTILRAHLLRPCLT